MPQALKPLCLIQFWNWKISLFSLSVLWGNKNWPPIIKTKQIENCQNKMGFKGCKWSGLNAPGTLTLLSHSVLELDISLFSQLALWGKKEMASQYEGEKKGKLSEQNGLKRLQMVQFECPRHSNPTLSFNFETCRMTPFLLLAVSGNKKWAPIKKVKN